MASGSKRASKILGLWMQTWSFASVHGGGGKFRCGLHPVCNRSLVARFTGQSGDMRGFEGRSSDAPSCSSSVQLCTISWSKWVISMSICPLHDRDRSVLVETTLSHAGTAHAPCVGRPGPGREEIPHLKDRHHAAAGDWESGAIAFVAARNGVRRLILRG
jgi:hypothetical protein